jgi:hypothetical protein
MLNDEYTLYTEGEETFLTLHVLSTQIFTNFVISLYGKYHQLILAQFGLVPPIY